MSNLVKRLEICDYEQTLQKVKMSLLELSQYDNDEDYDAPVNCHLIRAFHEINLAIESLRLVKYYLRDKKD